MTKEEGRRKKEEGRRQKEEGRRKKNNSTFLSYQSQSQCPVWPMPNAQLPITIIHAN
jgi:hypothetical protein